MKFISWLWEIPLSVASWIFFHDMKFILGRLYTFALSRMTAEAYEWKTFSRQTLARPFVLPIIATKGPRWNTHAILLTAGPLEVEEKMSFDVAAAQASAASWSIVLYANPGYQTVASIESFDVAQGEQSRDVFLKPGLYSINARYFGVSAQPVAPSVRIDGIEALRATAIDRNANELYTDLYRRGGWFYLALHYYVFHMLRFRRFLPQSFVRREFLPVGDPGTTFRYGAIRAGEHLEIEGRPELLEHYDVYVTLYNRSSFPVASETIRDMSVSMAPVSGDGFYLFRLRRKAQTDAGYRDEWLNVQAVRGPLADEARYRSASSVSR